MPLNGMGRFPISFMLLFGIATAEAQNAPMPPAPATENVTVTGLKGTEAAIGKFVEATSVATRAAGKLARWKNGVCPLVLGVPPDVGKALVGTVT